MDPKRLWFFDESGFYSERPRAYGRSPKGKPVEGTKRNVAHKLLTLIAMMNYQGIIAHATMLQHKGHAEHATLNAANLAAVFEEHILPVLPDDAILILDNASFHGKEFQALLEKHGVKYMRLPPYSPDLNPIELLFGWLKEARENLIFDRDDSCASLRSWLAQKIAAAPPHIKGWFEKAGVVMEG